MRVFLLAGEPSGDRLGGALMQGLRELVPDVQFDGIGGPLMQQQGLISRFPMEELSVMGIAEVLPKYRQLKRRIAETAQAVLGTQPDVMITIDSPDFSLRVAKLVKEASAIRTVHYVAPSVWAWRPGRADKMAKVIDHVLALLPFEPPYMEAAGMDCDFVGHPVVAEPQATEAEIAALRSETDLGNSPFVLALPGSRKGEVTRLAATFAEALAQFRKTHGEMRVVVPATAHVAPLVRELMTPHLPDMVLIDPNTLSPEREHAYKRAAFFGAEIALAASGTVSLELAAARTPMVIAYRVQWLTWQIAKRMVKIDTATLVNLVSETRVVPECLGPDCTVENIVAGLRDVSQDPQAQLQAMDLTMKRLGAGGERPGLRAARAVLERLG
ncbi:MAG: lipid-A-disaccharide synthase [Rhodobacteraceae bacterium]|nr:lipid-A-disaccharide synthase [Paracoccaceae bacterium]